MALAVPRRVTSTDGVSLAVYESGPADAPTIVLVHGFGADKEGWLGLVAHLRGLPIVALDLPCFGAASAIDPALATAEHQAKALKGVLDALSISKAVVVGSSMGGAISLRFASDFPDVVEGLVLLGSVGPAADKSDLGHALDVGENPLIPRTHEEYVKMLDFVAEKKIFAPKVIVSHLASDQIARRDRLQAMFEAWIAQPEETMDAVLRRVKAPTVVMHGDHDRVIDLSSGRAIAERVPNAKLMVLEGIGHVPQFEATKRVAAVIADLAR